MSGNFSFILRIEPMVPGIWRGPSHRPCSTKMESAFTCFAIAVAVSRQRSYGDDKMYGFTTRLCMIACPKYMACICPLFDNLDSWESDCLSPCLQIYRTMKCRDISLDHVLIYILVCKCVWFPNNGPSEFLHDLPWKKSKQWWLKVFPSSFEFLAHCSGACRQTTLYFWCRYYSLFMYKSTYFEYFMWICIQIRCMHQHFKIYKSSFSIYAVSSFVCWPAWNSAFSELKFAFGSIWTSFLSCSSTSLSGICRIWW